MKWNLSWRGTVDTVDDAFAHFVLFSDDYAAVAALPVGGRHVDVDGDTWERIE